jgi:DNA anti-recombination protein RmuC
MTGLKGLFEDHYITVPDDKYDLLEGLYEKVSGLETKLDEQLQKNTELNKDAMVSRCINVFSEVAEGLTDAENEKLKSLAEGLEYDSEDQFRDKLSVLRENYFNNVSETNELANEIVGDTINESSDNTEEHAPSLDGPMKFYSDMLTRSANVEKQTNFMG